MNLPSLSIPEFETTLPSSGQSVKYRPFLVKEEKILLMALEGKDDFEITNAILNLLKSCILTEDVDVDDLSTFDVEWMFLKIRSKSVGEIIELVVRHPNKTDCTHRTKVAVSLDDVEVVGDIQDGKVMITDSVGIKLRYPNLRDAEILATKPKTEAIFELLYRCTEMIFDMDNVYTEFTEEDLSVWYEQLNSTQFEKISAFFAKIPKLKYDIVWKCEQCGETDKITLEGLRNFFM